MQKIYGYMYNSAKHNVEAPFIKDNRGIQGHGAHFFSHALLGLASTSCITPPLRTSSVVLSQFDSEPLVNLDSDGV